MSCAKSGCRWSTKRKGPNTSSTIATFVLRASRAGLEASSPLTAGNFAVRPALTFVGLNHIGEGRQLGLFRTVFGAAHKRVGAFHEQAAHAVSHVTKARHRVGRIGAARGPFLRSPTRL